MISKNHKNKKTTFHGLKKTKTIISTPVSDAYANITGEYWPLDNAWQ